MNAWKRFAALGAALTLTAALRPNSKGGKQR